MDGLAREWPALVQEYLTVTYGEILGTERLAGLSGSEVWRVRLAGSSFILKSSPARREAFVYTRLGLYLENCGISLPHLEGSWQIEGQNWLLLEDIPQPLPRARWWDDPAVVGLLYRLHQIKDLPTRSAELFQPVWTDKVSEAALDCFDTTIRQKLKPIFQAVQAQAQPLFEPACFISGDPNVMNWGVRENGSVVLFDWERFGRGTPVLDLAILHAGPGTPESFRRLATAYLACGPLPVEPEAVARMTRELWQAKLWNVVEFFYLWANGQAHLDKQRLNGLKEQFGSWIEANQWQFQTQR